MPQKERIRLNKYLSEQGVCSRREADDSIARGLVTINGQKALMGEKVTGDEHICLKGKPIKKAEAAHIYIILNKPRGIVCTTKNDKDNVIDYLKLDRRVFPVGRLDKDSQGLLLLTSDGAIVNDMMRAANGHEKEYIVTVDRPIDRDFIKKMSSGVYLDELNVTTRPCTVRQMGPRVFSIILTQGLNRQIRRMCQALGCRVLTLNRIRIMNLRLGNLELGRWRYVTPKELEQLQALCRRKHHSQRKV